MIISRSRAALVTLATSAVFAVGGLAPAASQAQWHNYCIAGHCITHSNYTIEGVHACGPSDYLGGNPSPGSSSWTKPVTPEEQAAQAEQDALTQFDGACPNP
jgi:hypothetical protein